MVLPDTELEGALNLAEQMRKNVEKLMMPHLNSEAGDTVTISLGASCLIPPLGLEADHLIKTGGSGFVPGQSQRP